MISGAGNLIKQGSGTAIFSGNNTFTGTTTINAGTLNINGSIAGPITVNGGGTLGGSGTVTGTVTNSGTVSPGTAGGPLGTLTITGNYNINPGATTHIELNAQGQASNLSVGGTANLDGALTVTPEPGNYVIGNTYTLLTAGAIAGTFSSVPSTVGALKADVTYNSQNITIQLRVTGTSIQSSLSSGNPNQQALGGYLDSLSPPAGSDLAITLGALGSLSGQGLADALESISPGRLNASTVVKEDNDSFVHNMNANRLAALRGMAHGFYQNDSNNLSKYSNKLMNALENSSFQSTKYAQEQGTQYDDLGYLWMSTFGRFSHADANDIDTGYTANTGGFALGKDRRLSEHFSMGASLGRYHAWINLQPFPDKNNVNTNFATVYASLYQNGYYLDVSLLGGLSRYGIRHHIQYANIDRVSTGKHSGFEVSPHIGLGKEFTMNTTKMTPYVSLDYIYIQENAYTLRGANSLDMAIQEKTANALATELGIKLSQTYTDENKQIIPEVVLSYTHKRARNGGMTAGLLGQPGNFTVDNFSGSRDQISFGIGLLSKFSKGGFIKAGISFEMGSHSRAFDVRIRAGKSF